LDWNKIQQKRENPWKVGKWKVSVSNPTKTTQSFPCE